MSDDLRNHPITQKLVRNLRRHGFTMTIASSEETVTLTIRRSAAYL